MRAKIGDLGILQACPRTPLEQFGLELHHVWVYAQGETATQPRVEMVVSVLIDQSAHAFQHRYTHDSCFSTFHKICHSSNFHCNDISPSTAQSTTKMQRRSICEPPCHRSRSSICWTIRETHPQIGSPSVILYRSCFFNIFIFVFFETNVNPVWSQTKL